MSDKHTRGPWLLTRVPIGSAGGSNTCWKIGPFNACLYDDWRPREDGISEAENEANAQLMHAAPDLLDALRAAMFFVPEGTLAREAGDAAIAKAEGRGR